MTKTNACFLFPAFNVKQMTVKDLKQMLNEVNENMQVLIPVSGEFDGFFVSPCESESGAVDMSLDENLLVKETSFVLVPCGFFEEHDSIDPILN